MVNGRHSFCLGGIPTKVRSVDRPESREFHFGVINTVGASSWSYRITEGVAVFQPVPEG